MKKLVYVLLIITTLLVGCSSGSKDALVQYNSLDDIADELGYYPNTPQYLPGTDYSETYWLVDGDTLQVIYKNDTQTITYRTKKVADEAISGVDKSPLTESQINRSKGFDVTMYGKDGKLYLAEWSEDQKSFSLYFENGCTAEEFDVAIKGV
ncbi:hypothetical protein SDC9_90625 [bioreactor metagenome]|uniref:DUF4367 domain-containing protein n=1 Tax=bioreactor metagenome TaxID=1076179 RepID=A0A644ZT65_9ZZZZ